MCWFEEHGWSPGNEYFYHVGYYTEFGYNRSNFMGLHEVWVPNFGSAGAPPLGMRDVADP